MRRTLYYPKFGSRYAAPCHGYCDECIVRFKCYTNKDLGLDVTEEEATLCKDKSEVKTGIGL